jgi:5-deoxy-glucuronate isomerase
MWTSWPPHQHTKDLEEVYCYFDIPLPNKAFHFASRKAGEFEVIHPVSTGDCILVPEGYHPTCGMPGIASCYFWVMAAHRTESRRYDLAINDPNFE